MLRRKPHNLSRRPLNDYIGDDFFSAGNALRGDDRIVVYVEGYEDVSFWRNVFDRFDDRKFKIMTPVRSDLAKGKKVVLSFNDRAGKHLLLCVDSDFDYLFGNSTQTSFIVNNSPYVIQTYCYAIENLQCDPRTLQSVVTRVTNNDEEVFDFDVFFKRYSEIIYPLFLWYYLSAASNRVDIFTLSDFREAVKINFIEIHNNGQQTLEWLSRKVLRTLEGLEKRHAGFENQIEETHQHLQRLNVNPSNTCFYIQGHTLKDNVVKPVLSRVCEVLRSEMQTTIENSWAKSISKRNQLSGYANSMADIDTILRENTGYMRYEFYQLINKRISQILSTI